jgi:mono/diheme cytochrome c family protein
MNTKLFVASCLAIAPVAIVFGQTRTSPPWAPATTTQISVGATQPPSANARPEVATVRTLVDKHCIACHSARIKSGGVALHGTDLADVAINPATWERAVRKTRAGMMPPAGSPRIDPAVRETLVAGLEQELDRHAVVQLPPPGLHRLNRSEYQNAIRDLLALNVDAATFLPSDDSTAGFDNMAGTLVMSPPLLEAYLSAAGRISRLAIGAAATPTQTVYRVPEDATQDYHVEGLPFGTRGGLLVHHQFPSDGEYGLKVVPVNKGNMGSSTAFGEVRGEKLEVLLDGERVQLLDWDQEVTRGGTLDLRVHVKAGPHALGVTFAATNYAPLQDLNKRFLRSTIETGGLPGFTFFPHVGSIRIDGPYKASGATATPSRQKVFVCRPSTTQEESPASAKASTGSRRRSPAITASEDGCARTIVSTLARRAYRRPVTADDVSTLMGFYTMGRENGTFDQGIEMALRRLLADPQFLYRREAEPSGVATGAPYRISDIDLASRLSFFLWSSIPDEPLLALAEQRKLGDPAVLERQVRRMLADPRAEALVVNVAGQWLNLRGLQTQAPVVAAFPDFDDNLRQAFRRETELFFASIVHEDRSVLDLLTADYTFVNERLATHYGIPNVYGSHFRRVTLGKEHDIRRGLLGHGSQLTVSSQPGRTSPVQRGKWFMQTFLGVSPPSPPPGVVIQIASTEKDAHGGTKQSMRQQMELHRTTEPCKSCHRIMDPIGFSLENFDAVGKWRSEDGGVPVDAKGELVDGTPMNGPASLRDVVLRYSPQFVRVATEKLLIYALGRGAEHFDMPLVRSIVRDAAPDNYRFSSLVLGIVKSQQFQMNTKTAGDAVVRVANR